MKPTNNGSSDGVKKMLRRHRAFEGALLGFLCGMALFLLGFNDLFRADISKDILILPGIACALVSLTRFRKIVRGIAVALISILFVVGYTPLASLLQQQNIRYDTLQKAPAIVVLSSYLRSDGTMNAAAQERALHSYSLLREGWSDRLILTNCAVDFGSQHPVILKQMQTLGLNYPADIVGPVRDTHDEAVAIAKLVKQKGWNQIILVTHPWHMQRAAALFEHEGLHVICSPCVEGEYDIHRLGTPGGRLHAFRNWLHETLGVAAARLKGWI